MSNFVIGLVIFAGLLVGGVLAHLLNKNDLLAKFLWMFAGAVPGVTLLAGGPVYFNLLIILPLLGVTWRRVNTTRKQESQFSGV